ncbi:MAG: hypothetical protein ACK4XJ_05885 [Fimbriimonadaceae bacterium]
MEPIRYRPADAIRWLHLGTSGAREMGPRRSADLVRSEFNFGDSVKAAAGAVWDFGKTAWASAVHQRASGVEYVLFADRFEVVRGDRIRVFRYADIERITVNLKNAVTIHFQGSHIVVQPPAHIVAGRVRAPLGWSRNGVEVPFELLIDELAARAGVEPEVE